MVEPASSKSSRRDAARDDRLDVLSLLEEGTINPEEAATLLEALDQAERQTSGRGAVEPGMTSDQPPPRQIRIRVTDSATDRPTVNLALPLGLLDTGLAMARRFAPAHLPDDAAIRALIASSRRGPLLDISDGGERVEIIIE